MLCGERVLVMMCAETGDMDSGAMAAELIEGRVARMLNLQRTVWKWTTKNFQMEATTDSESICACSEQRLEKVARAVSNRLIVVQS